MNTPSHNSSPTSKTPQKNTKNVEYIKMQINILKTRLENGYIQEEDFLKEMEDLEKQLNQIN